MWSAEAHRKAVAFRAIRCRRRPAWSNHCRGCDDFDLAWPLQAPEFDAVRRTMKSQRTIVEPVPERRKCAERAPMRTALAETKGKRWLRLTAGLLWAPDIDARADHYTNEQKR